MAKRLTDKEFIDRSSIIHKNKYSYEKVKYEKWDSKVIITCPIHGDFEQRPNGHLNGKGCDKCAREFSGILRTSSKDEFIKKANLMHNGVYNYDKVIYENANKKVIITCKLHGDWEQKPGNHLSNKGCPSCAGNELFTKEKFIEKAIEAHGIKYDYSKVIYTKSQAHVNIICPEHGEFTQRANHHIQGVSCPSCNEAFGGFKITKPGILYYLSINNGEAYKIGITNHSVKKRYSPIEFNSIKIIKEWNFENGKEALNEEKRILEMYKKDKYTKRKLLIAGNTELFNKDVLNIYKDRLLNEGVVEF